MALGSRRFSESCRLHLIIFAANCSIYLRIFASNYAIYFYDIWKSKQLSSKLLFRDKPARFNFILVQEFQIKSINYRNTLRTWWFLARNRECSIHNAAASVCKPLLELVGPSFREYFFTSATNNNLWYMIGTGYITKSVPTSSTVIVAASFHFATSRQTLL